MDYKQIKYYNPQKRAATYEHKWVIDTSEPGGEVVERDGIPWGIVKGISMNYDAVARVNTLTLECYIATPLNEPKKRRAAWKLKLIPNNPERKWEIWHGGKFVEEAVGFELVSDTEPYPEQTARITVIANDIEWRCSIGDTKEA